MSLILRARDQKETVLKISNFLIAIKKLLNKLNLENYNKNDG